jgi:hypothetical protein
MAAYPGVPEMKRAIAEIATSADAHGNETVVLARGSDFVLDGFKVVAPLPHSALIT